jgi:hypothetical protein
MKLSAGLPPLALDSADVVQTESAQRTNVINAVDSFPMTPESNRSWPVIRFLLTLLIIAVILYFVRHR